MGRPRVLFVADARELDEPNPGARSLCLQVRAEGWDVHYVAAIDAGVVVDEAGRTAMAGQVVEGHRPDIALAFGSDAVLLVKRAAPTLSTVFMASTCRQGAGHVAFGRVADLATLMDAVRRRTLAPRIVDPAEREAVSACDLLVADSADTLALFEYFFPTSIGKMLRHVISLNESSHTQIVGVMRALAAPRPGAR